MLNVSIAHSRRICTRLIPSEMLLSPENEDKTPSSAVQSPKIYTKSPFSLLNDEKNSLAFEVIHHRFHRLPRRSHCTIISPRLTSGSKPETLNIPSRSIGVILEKSSTGTNQKTFSEWSHSSHRTKSKSYCVQYLTFRFFSIEDGLYHMVYNSMITLNYLADK
ncbi:unnamed protein product [Heterobilharzia americana]|nr:unnamed protein product [Heterobilharzia americana]